MASSQAGGTYPGPDESPPTTTAIRIPDGVALGAAIAILGAVTLVILILVARSPLKTTCATVAVSVVTTVTVLVGLASVGIATLDMDAIAGLVSLWIIPSAPHTT